MIRFPFGDSPVAKLFVDSPGDSDGSSERLLIWSLRRDTLAAPTSTGSLHGYISLSSKELV